MDNQIKHFKSVRIIGVLLTILLVSPSKANVFELSKADGDSSQVFSMVEQMPQIIGGISELYKSIEYPREARDLHVEGKVFVQFVVDTEGNVKEPKVLKDIGFGCGEAALEAIQSIKFTPGIQNGVEVPVNYTLPVSFKLKE
jgi:TonB family protein